VNLGHGITFGLFTIGIICRIITIGSNIIPGGKLNKRVFYYSVELFCLILLDYSVWKMYQTNFFSFFPEQNFFKAHCVHVYAHQPIHVALYSSPSHNKRSCIQAAQIKLRAKS
jgi:hypothetical protein